MFASRLLGLYSGYAKSAARLMSAANHTQYLLDTRLPCQVAKIVHDNVSAVVDHGIPQPTCSFCLRDFPCLRNDFGFDISRLFGPVDAVTGPHNPLSGFVLGDHKKPHCLRFSLASLQFAFRRTKDACGIDYLVSSKGWLANWPCDRQGASCTPHLHKLR